VVANLSAASAQRASTLILNKLGLSKCCLAVC
jgi:hypothetical protein